MRKYYRRVRELTLGLAQHYSSGSSAITEENAGLHFLMKIPDGSPLPELFADCGVKLSPLSEFFDEGSDIPGDISDSFVVNYASADAQRLAEICGE